MISTTTACQQDVMSLRMTEEKIEKEAIPSSELESRRALDECAPKFHRLTRQQKAPSTAG